MRTRIAAAFLTAFCIVAVGAPAQTATEHRKAPEWAISEWINSPGLTLADLRGKVVVIDFFQLWCPGCNKFSIPLMHHWEGIFEQERKDGKIAFVSIHTVFEGHSYQRPKRLRAFVEEKNITHPVGVDRHADGRRLPITMERYRTRGTPEMAIIDQQGNIRFQQFGYFEPDHGERLIRTLLAEETGGDT